MVVATAAEQCGRRPCGDGGRPTCEGVATMSARKEGCFGPRGLCLGIDAGKSFHWAMAVGAGARS